MEEMLKNDRAWIEINSANLEKNVKEINKIIPNGAKIMAIVKANAYGHGIVEISKILSKIGIKDFAVATLSEGIKLRQNNIDGNILILGYTDFKDLKYAIRYNLMQTIVDYDYAKKINKLPMNGKLKAHIKINTGMNRIGESYKNIGNIIEMYSMKNLQIEGIYSHLCVSESTQKEDIEFTKEQIKHFNNCIKQIKEAGYEPGKTHIQNSYGILNYPEIQCDYVRPGIILYGSKCDNKTITKINLKQVLSLKARVTSVKIIEKGETVSYGRTFTANTNRKIATVSIGYADGYPRNLSGKKAKVLINGKYAEIIGRICMDQLVIDVTDISEVNQGDIVTLIGEEPEITIEEISEKAETITNELLSRLGERLEKIII